MSQSRCTLSVRGLDCPNEVEILRAALEGSPGVTRLGFDLIHGLMTVDYESSMIDHEGLIRRRPASEQACRRAWRARPRRPSPALRPGGRGMGAGLRPSSSGLALAAGLAAAWLGPRLGPGRGKRWPEAGPGCFAPGGLLRRGLAASPGPSQPEELPARYRRAHGSGHPGGDRAGAMGRGGDRGLPLRPVRVARVAEPGACSPGDPRLCWRSHPRPPNGSAPMGPSSEFRPARSGRATASWSGRATRFRSMECVTGPFERGSEDDHRVNRCRWNAGRAIPCTRGRSTARARSRSKPSGRWATP